MKPPVDETPQYRFLMNMLNVGLVVSVIVLLVLGAWEIAALVFAIGVLSEILRRKGK